MALSPYMGMVISIDGQIEDLNAHWEALTGHARIDLEHSYLLEYIHFEDREKTLAQLQNLVTSDIGSASMTFRFLLGDGNYKKFNWTVMFSPLHESFFCLVRDASSHEGIIRNGQAYKDVLTGIDNRLSFEDSMPKIMSLAKGQKRMMAFFFIDLDGFKQVNDSLGHKAGDLLLVRAARRIAGCVGDRGIVFRMGGDEFIVVLFNITGREEARDMAGQVVDRLGSHYVIEKQRMATGASMGISMYPHDGHDVDDLVEKADKAMYYVKYGGKNGFSFYADLITNCP